MLRVEASDDKEGDTNLASVGAGGGIVHGGAVAGFSLPTLNYYVSNGSYRPVAPGSGVLTQLSPGERAVLPTDKPLDFTWEATDNASTYRLEVEDLQGNPIISAILTTGAAKQGNAAKPSDGTTLRDTLTYRAPSWLKDKIGASVARWRIVAFDRAAHQITQTDWRALRFGRPASQK